VTTRSGTIDLAVKQALAQLPDLIGRYGSEITDEPCRYDVKQGALLVVRERDGTVFTLDPRVGA